MKEVGGSTKGRSLRGDLIFFQQSASCSWTGKDCFGQSPSQRWDRSHMGEVNAGPAPFLAEDSIT